VWLTTLLFCSKGTKQKDEIAVSKWRQSNMETANVTAESISKYVEVLVGRKPAEACDGMLTVRQCTSVKKLSHLNTSQL